MIRLRSAFKVGLTLAFILGLSSCGSDKKEEDTSPCAATNAIVAEATYASLWANVFSGRCGTCHGAQATGTLGGPDMRTKDVFYEQLVGKTINSYPNWDQAQDTKVGCLDVPLINAGNSAKSLVAAVLDPTLSVGCTVQPHREQPPQNICISNGSLAALKKWIDNGAPQ